MDLSAAMLHAYQLTWYNYVMTTDLRLARRVRSQLAYHGVSANHIAAKIGMSQSALSSRLTGQVDFRFGELQAIARELGVPVMQLIPAEAAEVA